MHWYGIVLSFIYVQLFFSSFFSLAWLRPSSIACCMHQHFDFFMEYAHKLISFSTLISTLHILQQTEKLHFNIRNFHIVLFYESNLFIITKIYKCKQIRRLKVWYKRCTCACWCFHFNSTWNSYQEHLHFIWFVNA